MPFSTNPLNIVGVASARVSNSFLLTSRSEALSVKKPDSSRYFISNANLFGARPSSSKSWCKRSSVWQSGESFTRISVLGL